MVTWSKQPAGGNNARGDRQPATTLKTRSPPYSKPDGPEPWATAHARAPHDRTQAGHKAASLAMRSVTTCTPKAHEDTPPTIPIDEATIPKYLPNHQV
jgi:hypothetical protein